MEDENTEYAENMNFVGWSDQGGRQDGVQINVIDGYAYIGHMFSQGFTVIDVRNPENPEPVAYRKAPEGTWALHLQAHDDLLLVVNAADLFSINKEESDYYSTSSMGDYVSQFTHDFSAGLRIYDISDRADPTEISFMPVDGTGLHRLWYDGGQYAYASALLDGFSDYIFIVIDVSDPMVPEEVSRWWIEGMAENEEKTWSNDTRVGLHHAIIDSDNDIAYGSWRDGGLTILDVSDPANPTLVAHRNWSPPFGGGTHTSLPLPDRDLTIVLDEAIADNCADGIKHIWTVDTRDPSNPVPISTFPIPNEEDYCKKGAHFGPHNLHENRSNSFQSSDLIFATYQNAGVRAYDITNPFRPIEVGHFVPPGPNELFDTRPNRPKVIQTTDVFVDNDGLLYLTDYNAGLYIVEFEKDLQREEPPMGDVREILDSDRSLLKE